MTTRKLESDSRTARPLLTLTTDFGLADPYVGQLKAAVLRDAPDSRIIDLSHDVPPHDIRAAGFLVESSFAYTPSNSVHLCVVDPGVGSSRGVLAAACAGHRFLAPDNGLLDRVFTRYGVDQLVAVDQVRWRRQQAGTTFDGRDLFAPLAAALLNGGSIETLGHSIAPTPTPEAAQLRQGEQVEVPVLWIDRFGNVVLDLHQDQLPPEARAELTLFHGRHEIRGIRRNYLSETDEPFALIGSTGYLEIACRQRSAASALGLTTGDRVLIGETK